MVLIALGAVVQAQAQTADEIVEKHLAAVGGRAALAKLQTRSAVGTIMVSTQGMDLGGTIEMYAKAPNKMRTFFRLDLSAVGAGEMVIDQRCDGKTAFMSNSMQGDREITGNQLQNMLNTRFPSGLMSYKEDGAKVELAGKDKIGERAVFIVVYTPKAGSAVKQYFDAETYLLLRTVAKVEMPAEAGGGEMEQTTDLSDYRDVDGVKIPFKNNTVSPIQTIVITMTKVEHNKPIDDAMFARPTAK